MVDKWYRNLTPEEKAKTLLLGNDVYAFFHSDPETCIDTQGCTSPITTFQAFEIVNDELIPLWFKVEAAVTLGDPTKWSDLTKELGLVPSNGRSLFYWTPSREIPASLTHEIMTITVRAYKDSGYTQLYGEDTITWEFYFFDHSWASAVIIDEDDFENTLEGWSHNYGVGTGPYVGNAYKGAYSLMIRGAGTYEHGLTLIDESGQRVPHPSYRIYKSFTVGAYSNAFIIVHLTKSDLWPNGPVRVRFDTKDYIIRTNIPAGSFQPWRCACPIPVNATTELSISVNAPHPNYGSVYMDDILVVAFP